MDTYKKLLVTGFDPFGGQTVNPSWEAVKLLPDIVGDYRLYKLEVPTVYGKAARLAIDMARDIGADAVLSIGQAGGRASVACEFVAINHRGSRSADNEGNVLYDIPVVEGGPAAYFATVPVKAMAEAIKAAGYPSAVSYSAGTFVCNDLFYTVSHEFADSGVSVGFIHVPFVPEQVKRPDTASMPLCDIASAVLAAIGVM